jgi:hypothetical protein
MQLTLRVVPGCPNHLFLMHSVAYRQTAFGEERKHDRKRNQLQPAPVLRVGQPVDRTVQHLDGDLSTKLLGCIRFNVCLFLYQRGCR